MYSVAGMVPAPAVSHVLRSAHPRSEVGVGSCVWYWDDGAHALNALHCLFVVAVGASDSNCLNVSQIVRSAHCRSDVAVGPAVWYCDLASQEAVTALHWGGESLSNADPDAVYWVPSSHSYQYCVGVCVCSPRFQTFESEAAEAAADSARPRPRARRRLRGDAVATNALG